MPFNGYGSYTPPTPAYPAVANTTILSASFNTIIGDMAAALSNCLTKDGQQSVTNNIPMAGFKLTGLGTGTAATDAINLGQTQNALQNWAVGAGTGDAITASFTPAVTALTDGMTLKIRAPAQNYTTTPTVTPNSGTVTAYPMTKVGGMPLAVGDIYGNLHELEIRYNAANTRWELLNPLTSPGQALLNFANNFTSAVNEIQVLPVPSGQPTPVTISSLTPASAVSTLITMVTSTAHGLAAGHSITIAGATSTNYNGTWTILSVPSTASVTFRVSTAPAAAASVVGTYTVGTVTVVPIGAAQGNYMHISGTTTITGFDTIQAGTERTLVFDGVLILTQSSNLLLPGGSSYTTTAGDRLTFVSEGSGVWRCTSYALASGQAITSSLTVPTRQTVLSGDNTSGVASFLTTGSLLTPAFTATVPMVLTFANGFGALGAIDLVSRLTTGAPTVACTALNTNYIYATYVSLTSVTWGATIIQPVYQIAAPTNTNGQYWYDITNAQMKLGNGSTWAAVNVVFVGEAVAGASTISSVVSYAFQRRALSSPVSYTTSTAYTFSHNLGIPVERTRFTALARPSGSVPWYETAQSFQTSTQSNSAGQGYDRNTGLIYVLASGMSGYGSGMQPYGGPFSSGQIMLASKGDF